MLPSLVTENAEYYVIDKPAGLAVEPVAHYPTVSQWLIDAGKIKPSDWPSEARLGVVHRLDVETSGILVWAKNSDSQFKLKQLWQGRAVEKTYLGLAIGELPKVGAIELPIKRDNRKDRQVVAVLFDPKARPAITKFRRLQTANIGKDVVSFFEAKPITGRTHQIRVHFQHLGHPVIGDKLYGNKASRAVASQLKLDRHFLHAAELKLTWQGKVLTYVSPLPEELANILERLGLDVEQN